MAEVRLPYQASREWLEGQIVAGVPLKDRAQEMVIDLDEVGNALEERAIAVLRSFTFDPYAEGKRVMVFDSGLEPCRIFGDDEDNADPMDEPIVDLIGTLPEVPEPTDDPEVVISAWEDWLRRYVSESVGVIETLNEWLPAYADSLDFTSEPWGPVFLRLAPGVQRKVDLQDGAKAVRDALAANLWERQISRRFTDVSVESATMATTPSHEELQAEHGFGPEEIAAKHLLRVKRRYEVAFAHACALHAAALPFDAEMERWAQEHGSERLRLGLADGYRMNARYIAERLAAEAPGFYAMPSKQAGGRWARKASSPSEAALRLRRRVAAAIAETAPQTADGPSEVEIMEVSEPPVQVYLADSGIDAFDVVVGTELPDRRGWPWSVDGAGDIYSESPHPFEAVVVKNWLSRFHLIGAVRDEHGVAPPGIWAAPELEHFHEDGSVVAQNPDVDVDVEQARRKPPSKDDDDDLPF